MPPIVAVSREAMSTPELQTGGGRRGMYLRECHSRPDGDPPGGKIDVADRREAFGGEQDVVVFWHRAGDQARSPALNGDRYTAGAAHVQQCSDFGCIGRSDQGAGTARVPPCLIGGTGRQHVGVGDDEPVSHNVRERISQTVHPTDRRPVRCGSVAA